MTKQEKYQAMEQIAIEYNRMVARFKDNQDGIGILHLIFLFLVECSEKLHEFGSDVKELQKLLLMADGARQLLPDYLEGIAERKDWDTLLMGLGAAEETFINRTRELLAK